MVNCGTGVEDGAARRARKAENKIDKLRKKVVKANTCATKYLVAADAALCNVADPAGTNS